MKRLYSVLLITIAIFLFMSEGISATENITVTVDGIQVQFDTQPDIINNRVMVPMRAIFETVGASVEWDPETRSVYGSYKGLYISFTIDSKTMLKNFVDIELDTPPMIINDRTYLPVRAVGEGLGFDVQWDGNNKRVIITTDSTKYIEMELDSGVCFMGEFNRLTGNGYVTMYENSSLDSILRSGQYESNIFIKGITYFNDGAYFIGTYQNEFMSDGTLYHPDGTIVSGHFENQYLNGDGKIIHSNGFVREGTFVNGKLHGYGKVTFPSGDYNEGNYVNNVENGESIEYYPDLWDVPGGVYANGVKENNVWVGIVVFRNSDGEVLEVGESVNGEIEFYENVEEYLGNYNNTSSSPQASYSDVNAYLMSFRFPFKLYSYDGKTYLGEISSNVYGIDNIFNEYGTYGSSYSAKSVWNEYGTYGSRYSANSINNKYATEPPVIISDNGEFVGYLTENSSILYGITMSEMVEFVTRYK